MSYDVERDEFDGETMPRGPQTDHWWSEIESWHGAFLRRHSRLMLRKADAIELGGDPPSAQTINANPASLAGQRVISECSGDLELTKAGVGEWSGRFRFRVRFSGEIIDDEQDVDVRLLIASDDAEGLPSYRLAFDRYRAGTNNGDVGATLAVPLQRWLDENRIDWLFPDPEFVVSVNEARPSPLFAAIDMSALHEFAWSEDDRWITEVHRHQQQWIIVPDGVTGMLLPRPTRYKLYFPVTRAYPAYDDAVSEAAKPASGGKGSPAAPKSSPKFLAQFLRQAEGVYAGGGRITVNARKVGKSLDDTWIALEQGDVFANKDIVKMFREKLPEALRTSKLHAEMNELPNQTMKLPTRPVVDIDTKIGWVSVSYDL